MEIEIEIIGVGVVLILICASILGGRIGVAAPLLLVVVGAGIGYLPFVPPIEVDPHLILFGVLPPLLYAAAVNTPMVDFRRNLAPIAGLSVVLVILSALLIGWLLHLAVPAIPFPVAVALAAVISPTDAVAATSIGKRLGMPERLVSILEGESLVNDATSLVLLKTAIAAIAGSFVFWNSAGGFAFSVAAAIIIGYLVGVATVWVRAHLRNPLYDTLISFIVPFVAFIPAEEVHASGVLAVVVTGLYTGHHSSGRFSAIARVNERLNWRTIQFIIENGVFLLMGLELHALVDRVGGSELPLSHVAVISAALVGALIITRTLFMLPLLAFMRRNVARYEVRRDGLSRQAELTRRGGGNKEKLRKLRLLEMRTQADLEHEREQQLDWRDGTVLSWAGMRGVITLAAAQSIPHSVAFRPQLVLIAFIVAVATLLLHGLTLPLLIRKLWPAGTDSRAASKELFSLRRDLIEAGNAALDEALEAPPADEKHFVAPPENIVRHVRASVRNALSPLAFAADETEMMEAVEAETPAQAYLRLTHEVLEAQRAALLEERAIGRYSSQSLHTAELALDAYEARLSTAERH